MFWVFWLQGMWDLSSLTGDQTCTPCIERWSLNHWTTREVLRLFLSVIEMSDFYCWIAYCSFQFCQFCFMYFRALLLHVYTFIMCIFSWYSDSSVIIRCLSLSLVTFFVFKSLLSDINIAIPALYVERQWHPTPVLLPGKSHGRRSLMGCSPWGLEESDTTERLHFHFSLACIGEGNGNPLQCSYLENPRDRGAWWAVVYGVAQSRTRLKQLSSSSSSLRLLCT